MTEPRHPFESLLARLTQAMSPTGSRVSHELGTKADAVHTTAERIVWIPDAIGLAKRAFALTDSVSQSDQASDFLVSIYGATYWRVLDLHAALVGWLDVLVGPESGAAPSGDATPAVLTGATDLAALAYPTSLLADLHLDFTSPLARRLTFPSSALANQQAIVDAINVQANSLRVSAHACLVSGDGAEVHLKLYSLTGELDQIATTLTLDPNVAGSACAALGFSSAAGNLSATGLLPAYPYRPGYRVAKSEPGPRGGNLASSGWGVVVPVRLYQTIRSLQYLVGTTQVVPITAAATGGAGADDTLVNPGS